VTPVVTTIAEVRAAVADARRRGLAVGFVPTMGALHEGHAALVRAARAAGGFVVVSVFVNPTQFGPAEDFAKYPRTLDADRAVCHEAGADLVFAPTAAEMYPERSLTVVEVTELDRELCGPRRPGHFRGVATVVLKLFNVVQPDRAYFGAKDYQQARIVTQMARDLNVPVEVVVEPTVREADGLAMSSRNRYLSPAEREAAPAIYRVLRKIREHAVAEADVPALEAKLRAGLEGIPGARVDYARIVDAETLQPVAAIHRPVVAAVAVFLGTTRLIDNVVFDPVW
jgi:pantoate--beta-alanine ligase